MLYHLTTNVNPVLILAALMATALFIGIMSVKEKKHDPERA